MPATTSTLQEVDAATLRTWLERDEAVLFDVREADEWHAGHADGARWIPMSELNARQADIPPDRPLLVICATGSRSARVVAALVHAGYDAANVTGGMKAWQAMGYDVVDDDGHPGVVL